MNITQYIKGLDDENERLREVIRDCQVRLQQNADLRVMMMQREEERAHRLGEASPFGAFPNGSSLAFRDPVAYQPQGPMTPEQIRTFFAPPPQLPAAAPELVKKHDGSGFQRALRAPRSDKGKAKGGSKRTSTRTLVERIFLDRPNTPLRAGQVRDLLFPSRVATKQEAQLIYQAMFELKKRRIISQPHPGASYMLRQEEVAA